MKSREVAFFTELDPFRRANIIMQACTIAIKLTTNKVKKLFEMINSIS